MNIADDLVDELDSFDPSWRVNYPTLAAAADAAGPYAYNLYLNYALGQGKDAEALKKTSVDWNEVNRVNRALREQEIKMANETKY